MRERFGTIPTKKSYASSKQIEEQCYDNVHLFICLAS